jgi:hypothetical protein
MPHFPHSNLSEVAVCLPGTSDWRKRVKTLLEKQPRVLRETDVMQPLKDVLGNILWCTRDCIIRAVILVEHNGNFVRVKIRSRLMAEPLEILKLDLVYIAVQ